VLFKASNLFVIAQTILSVTPFIQFIAHSQALPRKFALEGIITSSHSFILQKIIIILYMVFSINVHIPRQSFLIASAVTKDATSNSHKGHKSTFTTEANIENPFIIGHKTKPKVPKTETTQAAAKLTLIIVSVSCGFSCIHLFTFWMTSNKVSLNLFIIGINHVAIFSCKFQSSLSLNIFIPSLVSAIVELKPQYVQSKTFASASALSISDQFSIISFVTSSRTNQILVRLEKLPFNA